MLASVEPTVAWETEGGIGAALVEGGEATGYLPRAPTPRRCGEKV